MTAEVRAFAPASVGNVACGFDVLGLCLGRPGDEVILRKVDEPGIRIVSIEGDGGFIPWDAHRNSASVSVMTLLGDRLREVGCELEIKKGIPLGSGMGGSAASAVAAVVAADHLWQLDSSREDLLKATLAGEEAACGSAHADNAAPSLFGGITLIPDHRSPPINLPVPANLSVALVHPRLNIRTRDARRVLPKEIPLDLAVRQWGLLAGFVAALYEEDFAGLARSLHDLVVEPRRAHLLPGLKDAQLEARNAGALGCSFSGSGPAVFALCEGDQLAEDVAERMAVVFEKTGVYADRYFGAVATQGARILD